MAALGIVLGIALVVTVGCRILSGVTGDTSWVDRIWSIVPVVYVAVFAIAAGLRDARLDVMALLVLLWGVRLTANFARKGGYRGVEDYRWAILRERMSPRAFRWFDTGFIAIYQNALLVLLTMPALTATQHRTPFGTADAVLAVVFLLLLVGEAVADGQQWRFQQEKRRRAASGATGPGFVRSGLWRFSRHPNFFFEIAQWWVVFLLGAVAAGSLLQWTVLGAVLLTVLFAGSTMFTESISAAKYPDYAEYRRTTSPLVPLPPRRARP